MIISGCERGESQNEEPLPQENEVIGNIKFIGPIIKCEEQPENIYFLSDKQNIRIFEKHNTAYIRDIKTTKIVKCVSLPDAHSIKGIREPDGKYVVCFEVVLESDPNSNYDERSNPAKVVDTDTGDIVCQVKLPVAGHMVKIHWLNNQEALGVLVSNFIKLCHFNYLTGNVIKETNIINNTIIENGGGESTEDGNFIFIIDGLGKSTQITTEKMDISTGKITETQEITRPFFVGSEAGLIPGNKYFYFIDNNISVFDRNRLSLISEKKIKKYSLESISFNSDGSRYAVAGWRTDSAKGLEGHGYMSKSLIFIYNTLSNRRLGAFYSSVCSSTPFVKVKLSPDGKTLALINDNKTVELWDLSGLN